MKTLKSKPIYITDKDKRRLKNMIQKLKNDRMNRDDLTSLEHELDRAIKVKSRDMPRNVVTMNSRVALVDLDTSERLALTLVFPEDADAEKNKISVLAPIGSGMLGYQVGDEFEWEVPKGTRRFTIAKIIYQPEARERSLFRIPTYARM